jgi:hypothetical protein
MLLSIYDVWRFQVAVVADMAPEGAFGNAVTGKHSESAHMAHHMNPWTSPKKVEAYRY